MNRVWRCGLVVCLWAAAGHAQKAGTELKHAYPLRDDCGPQFESRFWERAGPAAKAARLPSVRDQDWNNIAILEDDGLLVVFVTTPNFQGFATHSSNIARRFYATHPDTYDYLVIFTASTFAEDVQTDAGGFAFELNVANDVEGIGLPVFNNGNQLVPGLTRLRSVVNMNDLGEYSEDPSEELPGFLNTFSGIDVLGQEAEHMVGAFVTAPGVDILGRGNSHWSYFFETYGSVMEGNGWLDHGDGTFTTVTSGVGYSELDLYLYGLIDASEVTDPMYVVRFPVPSLGDTGGDATLPVRGVRIAGTRTAVSAEGIVAINGPRVPGAADAPKSFSMAWVLVIPEGTLPAPHDLEKIDEFRLQWEEMFARESNGVGAMSVRLGAAPVSADFETRVFAGAPGLTVPFDNDSFGNIDVYAWDFGDGQKSSERHPLHTYTAPGTYDVRLTVTGDGGSRTAVRSALVHVGEVITYFFDDFETDRAWFRDARDTATTGLWTRANPEPTVVSRDFGGTTVSALVQPEDDHSPAGVQCYVTGNAPRSSDVGRDDVDGGVTSVLSPIWDLSAATDPIVSFWFWYSNNAGISPGRDSLCVDVSNNAGASWVHMKSFHSSHYYWREEQLRLSDYVSVGSRMRVRFQARDLGGGSVVEAAIDDVRIFDLDTGTPVTLQDLAATSTATGVRLRWRLAPPGPRSGAPRVLIQRSSDAAGPWTTLAVLEAASVMSYDDRNVAPGETWWYRVVLEGSPGTRDASGAVRVVYALPTPTSLASAHEAADGTVAIRFTLAEPAPVRIEIYSVAGRRVGVLDAGPRDNGTHLAVWDRHDPTGNAVARGIYFVRFVAAKVVHTRKLVLVH